MDFYKGYFWTYSKTYGFTFAHISLFFVWRGNMFALLRDDLKTHNFHMTRENISLDLMTVLKVE